MTEGTQKAPKGEGKEESTLHLGMTEIILILVVALLAIGPDKLPSFARKLGEGLREFRKFSDEATKEIRESVIEPLEEAQKPLKEAMEPITELKDEVTGNVKEIKKSLDDLTKPAKAEKKEKAEPETQEVPEEKEVPAESPDESVEAETHTADSAGGPQTKTPAEETGGTDAVAAAAPQEVKGEEA